MTYQELIKHLQQLDLPKAFSYLPSSTSSERNAYTLLSVNENEIKVKRDETELSVSIAQINTIINNLSDYVPLDVEKTLGGSGNTRSIIESLFCLHPQVFHTRLNNRKHIICIPSKNHNLGELSFISESDLSKIISEHKRIKRQKIESEYKEYLTNIAISKRSGKRFTPSAISSYLLFTNVEKLFDYAPEKWKKIENIYDITSMDSISQIIKELKDEPEFCKRNHEDNNGWRLGAINQYFDYLVFKNNNIKQDDEDTMEPVMDENMGEKKSNLEIFKKYYRYINSLLAKPFVILTGNSGTGKTRIATKFAEYMKQDDNLSNSLLVPVGADWTDNTKILGYYNPLANNGTGKYEKTPIFEFLERAVENSNIPYFLILDEMNLSHVERYFSDFLSKMELVDYKNQDKKTYFDIPGYGLLEFPKNLFITGTVNIDETTYMFSPKVLDRANVIEFKPEKDTILDTLLSDNSNNETEPSEPNAAESFMKLANEVRSGEIPENAVGLLNEIHDILDSFYTELEKFGFEFAYRTIKEIRLYTIAACMTTEGEMPTATQITDIQILQKILPKIHGNRKQIGELLENLEKLAVDNNLENSLKKIQQMKDRLNRFQYASFI